MVRTSGQIKKGEMGGACGTHGRDAYRVLLRTIREGDNLESLRLD